MPAGKLPIWQTEIPALMGVARRLTEMTDAINTLLPILGDGNIEVNQTPKCGTTIKLKGPRPYPVVMVKITGSLGKGNYSARQFSGVLTYTSGSPSVPGNLTDPGADNCIVVNLAEVLGGAPLVTDSWVIGVALGQSVNASSAGVALVVTSGFSGAFPVQVTQAGGADGTATSPASWTYTVKTVDGTVTLGTNVALNRPRPNGSMAVNSASPAFGLAFMDSTAALRLWDAGEVPNTDACS
jgi:hypothetical protein